MSATGIAVVGTGYWGPAIVRNLAALPDADLRVLVDRDVERARSTADKVAPGTPATADYASVLGDPAIEAIVIATPVRTHFELAEAALLAGKHVLVEKPLAMTVPECRRLESIARERDLVLMVGHIFRFNSAVEQVKEYIADGELGDVLYIHSRRVNLGRVQSDVNALWSYAPHDLSIVNHWLGAEPVGVACRGFSYVSKGVEDVVFCVLRYPNGVGAHLHLGWLDPRKVREMTVVGSRRMVLFDDVDPQAKIRLYDSSISPLGNAPPESFAQWQVDIRHGEVTIPRLKWVEPLRTEMQHFLDCVRDGVECRTPGSDGTGVTAAIVAAQESLKRGGVEVLLEEVLAD
jgi:predicted dehydrogenase